MDTAMAQVDTLHSLQMQIEAFEKKVTLCREKFSVPQLVRMIYKSPSVIPDQDKLMECNSFRQFRSVLRYVKKTRTRAYENTTDVSTVLQYFDWLFNLHAYLQTLTETFIVKIFRRLSQYPNPQRAMEVCSNETPSSRLSQLSQTTDSGISASNISSGQLALEREVDYSGRLSRDCDITPELSTIGQLYEEYEELKQLYDFREISETVGRISNLSTSLQQLLNGHEIDTKLFSPDSYACVANVDLTQSMFNVVRLFPDALTKLDKAAWLAKKWLRLIHGKPSDVLDRMTLLDNVEIKLSERVTHVKSEVSHMEVRLEEQVVDLSNRLHREDRAGNMKIALYELDTKISLFKTQLESARKEKQQIKKYLFLSNQRNQSPAIKQLLVHYRSNQLKRYSLAARISLLSYQRSLLGEDMNIELLIKPSIVACTNTAQEVCDRLENSLNVKRKEERTLERALFYIRLDKRQCLSNARVNTPTYAKCDVPAEFRLSSSPSPERPGSLE